MSDSEFIKTALEARSHAHVTILIAGLNSGRTCRQAPQANRPAAPQTGTLRII